MLICPTTKHNTISEFLCVCKNELLYLFGLVFLMVAWRNQAVGVDAFIVGRCLPMGTRVGPLHGQEGADALDFALETAIGQALPFGGQPTCSHPLGVLLLLEGERQRQSREREREKGRAERGRERLKIEDCR